MSCLFQATERLVQLYDPMEHRLLASRGKSDIYVGIEVKLCTRFLGVELEVRGCLVDRGCNDKVNGSKSDLELSQMSGGPRRVLFVATPNLLGSFTHEKSLHTREPSTYANTSRAAVVSVGSLHSVNSAHLASGPAKSSITTGPNDPVLRVVGAALWTVCDRGMHYEGLARSFVDP